MFVSELILIAGLCFGLMIGRWWALLAAVIAGAWVWITDDGEMVAWVAGLLSALTLAFPIAGGVLIRKSWKNMRATKQARTHA